MFLPNLRTSTNLIELRLDNSTLTVPETVENLYDLITDRHPLNILHYLYTCNQLQIFSCANCWIHWYQDNEVEDELNVIGHFCSQWLLLHHDHCDGIPVLYFPERE